MWASYRGHAEVVKLLLANGADINAETEHGSTALMRAGYKGHAKVVKLLQDATSRQEHELEREL